MTEEDKSQRKGHQVPTWLQIPGHIGEELLCGGLALEEVVDGEHARDHVVRGVSVLQVPHPQRAGGDKLRSKPQVCTSLQKSLRS